MVSRRDCGSPWEEPLPAATRVTVVKTCVRLPREGSQKGPRRNKRTGEDQSSRRMRWDPSKPGVTLNLCHLLSVPASGMMAITTMAASRVATRKHFLASLPQALRRRQAPSPQCADSMSFLGGGQKGSSGSSSSLSEEADPLRWRRRNAVDVGIIISGAFSSVDEQQPLVSMVDAHSGIMLSVLLKDRALQPTTVEAVLPYTEVKATGTNGEGVPNEEGVSNEVDDVPCLDATTPLMPPQKLSSRFLVNFGSEEAAEAAAGIALCVEYRRSLDIRAAR